MLFDRRDWGLKDYICQSFCNGMIRSKDTNNILILFVYDYDEERFERNLREELNDS